MSRHEIANVRKVFLDALKRDLIGPNYDQIDILNEPPTQAYLTGILHPMDKEDVQNFEEVLSEPSAKLFMGKEIDSETPINDESDRDVTNKGKKLKKQSSMGLRFYVDSDATDFNILINWAIYEKSSKHAEKIEKKIDIWTRKIFSKEVKINLNVSSSMVNVTENATLTVNKRKIYGTDNFIVSVFLSNKSTKKGTEMFQVEMQVFQEDKLSIFLCENDVRPIEDKDRFEEFLFRYKPTFAKGFGCAVDWEAIDEKRAVKIKTDFIPSHEIGAMSTELSSNFEMPPLPKEFFSIKQFSEISEVGELKRKLYALADRYEEWIINLPIAQVADKENAQKSIHRCKEALKRIRCGIDLLEQEKVFRAFIFMNKVMHTQSAMKSYSKNKTKTTLQLEMQKDHFSWRPFQLAFIMLNIEGLVKPSSKDREIVDLLWFPTGGGKTEAYLGIVAFLLGYRRLTASFDDFMEKDGGVTIFLRYTLRLLTTQQRDRLLRMISACEYVRQNDSTNSYGLSEFSIGFWVGGQVTANSFDKLQVSDFQDEKKVKFEYQKLEKQVIECPCCGSKTLNYKILPDRNPTTEKCGFEINCTNLECFFYKTHIPVYLIDEEIYRKLPTVIISTVDKFARLPWDEKCANLFGKVDRFCEKCGYIANGESHVSLHRNPNAAVKGIKPFYPPELIIQDELHLITGPLGTIYGGYETAIEELCSVEKNNEKIKPKYIVSTATIKNAEEQITRIYGRTVMKQFPPAGLQVEDSFFASEISVSDNPFRLYTGICISGHSMKTVLLRVYAILAQLSEAYQEDPTMQKYLDPYRTIIGYFNSIRELGGAVRLLEDDITKRIQRIQEIYGYEKRRYLKRNKELTSRVPSHQIPKVLEELELVMGNNELDVVLATNMISVGMDVDRLGLMVVTGQPKQTSEYIQATSRVGRKFPGLVVTVYNPYRPRDMSHYQNFKSYHSRLYFHVEGTTATPYSSRARERFIHAVAVALLRLNHSDLGDNTKASNIKGFDLKKIKQVIEDRVKIVETKNLNGTRDDLNMFLDDWIKLSELETKLEYYFWTGGRFSKKNAISKNRLLRRYSEESRRPEERATLDAMRDIETTANLFLYEGDWFNK